jgi:hypothetical protein
LAQEEQQRWMQMQQMLLQQQQQQLQQQQPATSQADSGDASAGAATSGSQAVTSDSNTPGTPGVSVSVPSTMFLPTVGNISIPPFPKPSSNDDEDYS